MVDTQYSYTPTALGKISDTLTSIFAELQGEDAVYNRSANCNLIILVSGPQRLPALEQLIDALSLAHPSRFFVAFPDPSTSTVQASISARCHGLSKTEHVCSEVIRLSAAPAAFAGIPSVIRAHMLTGMPTEIFLYDPDVDIALIRAVAPLADSIFLDSQSFSTNFQKLAELLPLTRTVVDFSWVGLGVWREELKLGVNRCAAGLGRPQVRSIEIGFEGPSAAQPGALALLFAGWVVNRLGAAVLECGIDNCIRLCGADGSVIELKFVGSRSDQTERLSRVRLTLEAAGKEFTVEMLRAKLLETTVSGKDVHRATRPFEDESFEGRVRRHFFIGESLANYSGAVRVALKIRESLQSH
ncbi:MAG: glucose-6-phosphate dehydrogenase assembly protein OpcA [Oligoflexia bacterium]|nr:glucose-6-phosphate dehydrogenase assembly protein OpcA [Oligoflexia bacterium]